MKWVLLLPVLTGCFWQTTPKLCEHAWVPRYVLSEVKDNPMYTNIIIRVRNDTLYTWDCKSSGAQVIKVEARYK